MLVVPRRDKAAKASEGTLDSRLSPIAGSVPLQQHHPAFVNVHRAAATQLSLARKRRIYDECFYKCLDRVKQSCFIQQGSS